MHRFLMIVIFTLICSIFMYALYKEISTSNKVHKILPNIISGNIEFERHCIDGVEYLYRKTGLYEVFSSPHYKQDGTLYICN